MRVSKKAEGEPMTRLLQDSRTIQSRIVVGIPTYDEEQFIAEVVGKAKKFADEVIVVDDGSTDNTAQVAEVNGASVTRHGENRGTGEATKSCFEAAKAKGADILVMLDGDGQHNPDEIPKLIAPILSREADLVIGSRFLGRQSKIPRYRYFGIKLITFLYNFGAKVKVSDSQSCYRAYGKEALDSLSITERGFGFSVELLIQARRQGLAVTEVPISCIYHHASHSTNPVIHGLGVALTVVRLRLKRLLCKLTGGSGA